MMKRIVMVGSWAFLLTAGLAWTFNAMVVGATAQATVVELEASQIYGGQSNCPPNSPDGTFYCEEACFNGPANTYCEARPYYCQNVNGTKKGYPINDTCTDCGTSCGMGQTVSCNGTPPP